MTLSSIEKILAFREAGQVRRAHTVTYLGEYNIAMHCYNALSLLLVLYPNNSDRFPSLNLIRAVLWHDTPERWTGDVPSPAKWMSPQLKDILSDVEVGIFKAIGIKEYFTALTQEEQGWLLGVDLLELFLWTEDQYQLGNSPIINMQKKIQIKFAELETNNQIPKEIGDFRKRFQWKRLPELDELLDDKI